MGCEWSLVRVQSPRHRESFFHSYTDGWNAPPWRGGRCDMVCPLGAAYGLHKKLENSTLEIVPKVGHTTNDDRMINAIIRATDRHIEQKNC